MLKSMAPRSGAHARSAGGLFRSKRKPDFSGL